MKYFLTLLVLFFIIQTCVGPPVTQEKKEEEVHSAELEDNEDLGDVKEYHRYLQEVIQALESDPDFRAKLEKADTQHIRSGDIAEELRFVNHRVRNKLDELKRTELERLKNYYEQVVANGNNDVNYKKVEYMNHRNPHTFEIDDLKKLIAQTAKDLDEADRKRRENFKEYEMNKKFDQEQKMKDMKEDEKQKYENELHDLEKKHKDHEPLHHPGSKKQLEEVWEKQDHMENQDFDPKTFFYLHDLDGNGVWDQDELKALFLKELDKLYAEGHPEDDVIERAEEMERMREHVITEVDLNKDGLISFEEFLAQSKKDEFEQDPGWEALDQQQIYSEQEYEAYRQQKAKEIERTISKGMSQDHHVESQPQPGQQQFPPHPNQVPQDHVQQVQYQNQVPQYNNQIPPQNGQYNQVPVQQVQYVNQMPQQQFQPSQVPVSNNINQPQQQNYPVPNQQVPVQQYQQIPSNVNPVPQQVPIQPQFQQLPPNMNAVPLQAPVQQQFQQLPPNVNSIPQQVPVQQFQQPPPNVNSIPQQVPVQQQFQQPPPNVNSIPQQVPVQQQFQQPPPNVNSIPQQQLNVPGQAQPNQPTVNAANLPNQQVPVVAGNNHQANDQIASMNNGQAHQNLPNHV